MHRASFIHSLIQNKNTFPLKNPVRLVVQKSNFLVAKLERLADKSEIVKARGWTSVPHALLQRLRLLCCVELYWSEPRSCFRSSWAQACDWTEGRSGSAGLTEGCILSDTSILCASVTSSSVSKVVASSLSYQLALWQAVTGRTTWKESHYSLC